MTGLYMKCNIGLKWVLGVHNKVGSYCFKCNSFVDSFRDMLFKLPIGSCFPFCYQ